MNCTHDNLIKLFWNGGNENGERLELNEKGVKYALLLALKDFTPRTEKRIGKDPFGAEEMLEELEKSKSYSQKFLKFFDDDKKDDNNNTQQDDNKSNNVVQSNSKSFASEAREVSSSNPLTKAGEVAKMPVPSLSSGTSKESVLYVKLGETVRGSKAQKMIDEYNKKNPYFEMKIDSDSEAYVTRVTLDFKEYSPEGYGSKSFPLIRYSVQSPDHSEALRAYGTTDCYEKTYDIEQGDIIDGYIMYALPKNYSKKFNFVLNNANENGRVYVSIDPSTL